MVYFFFSPPFSTFFVRLAVIYMFFFFFLFSFSVFRLAELGDAQPFLRQGRGGAWDDPRGHRVPLPQVPIGVRTRILSSGHKLSTFTKSSRSQHFPRGCCVDVLIGSIDAAVQSAFCVFVAAPRCLFLPLVTALSRLLVAVSQEG